MQGQGLARYMGLKINEARTAKGLGVKELSIKTGINTTTIYAAEAGKIVLGSRYIYHICYILKCRPGRFFPPPHKFEKYGKQGAKVFKHKSNRQSTHSQ